MRDARVCVRSSKQKGKTLEIREPILIVRTYFIEVLDIMCCLNMYPRLYLLWLVFCHASTS